MGQAAVARSPPPSAADPTVRGSGDSRGGSSRAARLTPPAGRRAVLTVDGGGRPLRRRGRPQRRQPVGRAGTVTGLIGPNGAGKTTLFNVISGLQTPDRGTVLLYDTDITRMKPHRRARLGLARTFQRLELFGTLSAGENVQVGLESSVKWWQWRHVRRIVPLGEGGRAHGRRRAPRRAHRPGSLAVATASDRLLEGVGLGGLADRQASAMPTGLARMVELARALAMAPKILLLDEPGSGLDDAESQALGDLLTTLAGGAWACCWSSTTWSSSCGSATTSTCSTSATSSPRAPPRRSGKDPMVQAAYLGEVNDDRRHRCAGGRPMRPADGSEP